MENHHFLSALTREDAVPVVDAMLDVVPEKEQNVCKPSFSQWKIVALQWKIPQCVGGVRRRAGAAGQGAEALSDVPAEVRHGADGVRGIDVAAAVRGDDPLRAEPRGVRAALQRRDIAGDGAAQPLAAAEREAGRVAVDVGDAPVRALARDGAEAGHRRAAGARRRVAGAVARAGDALSGRSRAEQQQQQRQQRRRR